MSVEMAEATEEMPLIAPEPDKMLNSWLGTMKLWVLMAAGCLLYGYMFVTVRTFMIKSKRLEQIGNMVMATEELLQNLYVLDHSVATHMEELTDYYLDY